MFIDIGQAGHINADSGHGEWPEGYDLFRKFIGV
jgi:predicted alpha/beta hydrolase family esterase